jgi:hypothetical protein
MVPACGSPSVGDIDSQRMLIRVERGKPGVPSKQTRRIQPPPPTNRRDKSLRLIKAIEAEELRSSLRLRAAAPRPS